VKRREEEEVLGGFWWAAAVAEWCGPVLVRGRVVRGVVGYNEWSSMSVYDYAIVPS